MSWRTILARLGWCWDRPAAAPRRHQQVAALPYRVGPDGGLEILLVTTRGSGRWIVPKGNLMDGFPPHEAAAREAMEEGGVEGRIATAPIGAFIYDKRRGDGSLMPCTVSVYPLAVDKQHRWWPEMEGRVIRWFSAQEAVEAVEERDLRDLVLRFRDDPKAGEGSPGDTTRTR